MYFNQIHEYFLVTTNAGVIMKILNLLKYSIRDLHNKIVFLL